ncbi:MAG: methylene-tetrahydromethanopterin dehydrogenase N-terminal domain-containing protein, partial [Gemmatimonadales bacterium]
VWIGGSNMSAGEQLLAMAQDALFGELTVSIMLDSNGSNTTAVAAVVKIEETLGDLTGKKAVILAGTGPVGQRAAGLLAHDGAHVTITSRKPEQGEKARQFISARFDVHVEAVTLADPSKLPEILEGADILLNSGPAGVQMVPRSAWTSVKTLQVAVDLNAVPPLGIEGVDVNDAGVKRNDVIVFGAFGIGNFKTRLHKACVAKLFTRNDLVLDAESIAEIARELVKKKKS